MRVFADRHRTVPPSPRDDGFTVLPFVLVLAFLVGSPLPLSGAGALHAGLREYSAHLRLLGNSTLENSSQISVTTSSPPPQPQPPFATTSNWPTYEFAGNRSGSNYGEVTLSPSNASGIQEIWNHSLPGPVFGSPSVVNGTVYIGSWDGYEYALKASDGSPVWKTPPYLGQEGGDCSWITPLGVTSSAAVYNGSVFVGSAWHYYRLNATSGAMEWNKTIDPTNGSNKAYYAWSSPLVYDGNVYVGVASQCDHPLVGGGVIEFNESSGALVNEFMAGNLTGSVWSTPTIDAANNTLWITTGNSKYGWKYQEAIIALNATHFNNTTVEGYWHVSHVPYDSDFGAGATMVTDAAGHRYVVATNKNGSA